MDQNKQTRDDLNEQDNRAGHFSRVANIPASDRRRSPVFYACKRAVINSALRIGRALYCNFAANAVSALKIRPGHGISPLLSPSSRPPLSYAAVIRIIGFSMVFSRVHAYRKCESREMHPGDDVIVRPHGGSRALRLIIKRERREGLNRGDGRRGEGERKKIFKPDR